MSTATAVKEPVAKNNLEAFTQIELRQIESGFSLFMQQPMNGARLTMQLLRRLNDSLAKVSDLEARVIDLESRLAKPATPGGPKKKPDSKDDI